MNLIRTLFLLLSVKCPDAVHAMISLTEVEAVALDESVSAEAAGEAPVSPSEESCAQEGTDAGQHMVGKWWRQDYESDCNRISDLTDQVNDELDNIYPQGEAANNCVRAAALTKLAWIQAQCRCEDAGEHGREIVDNMWDSFDRSCEVVLDSYFDLSDLIHQVNVDLGEAANNCARAALLTELARIEAQCRCEDAGEHGREIVDGLWDDDCEVVLDSYFDLIDQVNDELDNSVNIGQGEAANNCVRAAALTKLARIQAQCRCEDDDEYGREIVDGLWHDTFDDDCDNFPDFRTSMDVVLSIASRCLQEAGESEVKLIQTECSGFEFYVEQE